MLNSFVRRAGWIWVITASFLSGCAADKLVRENFSQIRPQVTNEQEVVKLIGEPDSKLQEYWVYQRPEKHLTAFVEFDDQGKVARTQWVDAMDPAWEDSKDSKMRSP